MKINTTTRRNIIIGIIITTFFFIVELLYLNAACINTVFMDAWREFANYGELLSNKNLTWEYVWHASFGQRSPLSFLIFYMNVQFFNYNSMADIICGAIVSLLTSLILVLHWQSFRLKNEDESSILVFVCVCCITCCFWNYNCWEITTTQFSNSFMIRIFSYMLTFIITDRLIHMKHDFLFNKYFFYLIFLLILDILFMGHVYFIAVIVSVIFVLLFAYLRNNNPQERIILKRYLLVFFSVSIVCVLIYFTGIYPTQMAAANGSTRFIGLTFMLGFFYSISAILIPNSILQSLAYAYVIVIGILIIMVFSLCAVIYFWKMMWKISDLPFLLSIYSLACSLMVVTGRIGFGPVYCGSSRYVCETRFLVVACILICTNVFLGNYKRIFRLITLCVCIIFISSMIITFVTEQRIAPFRKNYMLCLNNLILAHPNGLTENDNWRITQANSLDILNKVIPMLVKNEWGMFNYNGILNISGVYKDKWLANRSNFQIRTGSNTTLHIKLYQPIVKFRKMNGYVMINNERHIFSLNGEFTTLIFHLKQHSLFNVSIIMEHYFEPNCNDRRKLSVLLSGMSLQ